MTLLTNYPYTICKITSTMPKPLLSVETKICVSHMKSTIAFHRILKYETITHITNKIQPDALVFCIDFWFFGFCWFLAFSGPLNCAFVFVESGGLVGGLLAFHGSFGIETVNARTERLKRR
eukprot:440479_1